MENHPLILVVDDDELHLLLLKDLFTSAGMEVSCASSGDDALQELESRSFGYMITDLHMPHMSGLELAFKAKQIAPQMLIALCTGDDFPSMRWLAAEKGIETIFKKPVNYAEMMTMVFRALRKQEKSKLC